MKEKILEAGAWVKGLKWWQRILVLLILFPAIIGIIFNTGKEAYEFYYFDIKGNPRLSKLEKQSVLEFQKHWSEEPNSKKELDIKNGRIEVAYYSSDGCTLITRRFNTGRTLMKWLPYKSEEIKITKATINTPIKFISEAYATKPQPGEKSSVLGAHAKDLGYVDVIIGWVSSYEFVVERFYKRDGCIGRYNVWAPTGEACCWRWVVYKHR